MDPATTKIAGSNCFLMHLRTELEFSPQQQQGKSFVVVKDPVTSRYFRFTETQAAILEFLWEPINAPTLAARASEKLGGRCPSLRSKDSSGPLKTNGCSIRPPFRKNCSASKVTSGTTKAFSIGSWSHLIRKRSSNFCSRGCDGPSHRRSMFLQRFRS